VTNSLRHQLQAAHATIADLEGKIQHLSVRESCEGESLERIIG